MAASVLLSTELSGQATVTAVGTPQNVALDGGRLRVKSGQFEIPTANFEADDVVLLAGVPTGAVVHQIWIANDDLGSAELTCDVGIFKELTDTAENGDRNVYATLITQFQAAAAFTDLAFEARGIQLASQKVFEDAGDTVDTDDTYYIGLMVGTVATTPIAATLAYKIVYSVD